MMLVDYLKKRQVSVQKRLRTVFTNSERQELAIELEDLVHAVASFKRCTDEDQINQMMTEYPNIFGNHTLDTFDFSEV